MSRTLFELHAGRKPDQSPLGLSIDELEAPLSKKNEAPRSTSKDLIEALGKIGEEYRRPSEHADKIDLSYTDASAVVLDREEAKRQASANETALARDRDLHPKDVLVKYLRHVAPIQEFHLRTGESKARPQMDSALLEVFDHRVGEFLEKRKMDVTDVMTWSWILTADTAERAATRLAYVGDTTWRGAPKFRGVPNFVFVFLLRRRTINAGALKTLLIYAWDHMERLSRESIKHKNSRNEEFLTMHPKDEMLGIDEFMFMIVITRLLRRAREVFPTACESITALLCRFLNGKLSRKIAATDSDSPEEDTAALSFMYNSILKLVAEPARLHPFQSATHQQRAQFNILRRMDQFEPPLVVDRRGYRAVTRMQLMHKKTTKEREWAHLKAQSWPPWKEDRLGIDADIGPEYGISRAREVLNRAREAGYATDGWDDAASVLSGWDTDHSPTIQSRTILKDPATLPMLPMLPINPAKDAKIWAARIKATRTLDEAWAAFLSYEDSGAKRRSAVYMAMFEKLFYDNKRKTTKSSREISETKSEKDEEPLPGDGPEVYPAPISPRDAIYVRTAPPSVEAFFRRMIHDGIQPRGDFLVLLLRGAESLRNGVQYLKASAIRPERISALLDSRAGVSQGDELQKLLEAVPSKIFAAFIQLLTRFASSDSRPILIEKDPQAVNDENSLRLVALKPFNQAIRLVYGRKPCDRPPWYSLLAALSKSRVITPFTAYPDYNPASSIANWKTSYWLLESMEELDVALDLDGMKILCTGFEKAIFEAEEVVYQCKGIPNVKNIPRSDLELVLDKSLPLIKQIFRDIVRHDSMQQNIPQPVLDAQDQLDPGPKTSSALRDVDSLELDSMDEEDSAIASKPKTYLPPACLLPKLLEVPNPAHIHSFIRVLGLRRDYQGILDLIEWMALYADEIRSVTDEQQNSSRAIRKCMTATRVFLEKSWMYCQDQELAQPRWRDPEDEVEEAPTEIWQVVHDTIVETEHWGGWPTDEEVEQYCMKGRFI